MIGTVSFGSMAMAGTAAAKANKQTTTVSRRCKLTQAKGSLILIPYRELLANSGQTTKRLRILLLRQLTQDESLRN
jgi:hypothetical protein